MLLVPKRRSAVMSVTIKLSEGRELEGSATRFSRQARRGDNGKILMDEQGSVAMEDVPTALPPSIVNAPRVKSARSKRADVKLKSGGLLAPPEAGSKTVHMVTWNTGELDPGLDSNATHAERKFIDWLGGQPVGWRTRIQGIDAAINLSPCSRCTPSIFES